MRSRFWFRVILLCVSAVVLLGVMIARAQTRTLSWSPVTKYTDGTFIEAGNAVTYSAWRQDDVTKVVTQLVNGTASTSVAFDDATLVKNRTYKFWVQAQLQTGAASDNSAPISWTLPLGKAETPAGLVVQ